VSGGFRAAMILSFRGSALCQELEGTDCLPRGARPAADIPPVTPSDPFDSASNLRDLAVLYGELEELLALDPERLAAVVPERSGWSAEQHLAHVALANELVLRNLASLVAGTGALIVRDVEPHARAVAVLAEGRIPRGQAQSPRMVRPPERVQRELLTQWIADGRSALAALDAARVVPGELRIPHQLLGPLDGPQWARFAVVHTRHHLEIVRDVLGRE